MTLPRTMPLMFMAGLILAMIVLDQLFPALRAWRAPLTWFGLVPLLVGLTLVLVSAGLFRRRGTTLHPYGAPAVLVQDGLYRYTRNPMYLGMLLILTGLVLWLGQPLAGVWLPVFIVVVTRQNIRHEEQALEDQFGAVYHGYRRRVRRWL